MVLDVERDPVDRSDPVVALTEGLGDLFQPYLCHGPHATPSGREPPHEPPVASLAGMETEPTHADTAAPAHSAAPLDLDGIERDLADVEVALARLDAGTYWTDEVTGDPLPAEFLANQPTARRLSQS